jgi:hypothetical protein
MASRIFLIAELKVQISLLKKEEMRLHWVVSSSESLSEKSRMAYKDLYSVLDKVAQAELELSCLEKDA